MTIINEWSEPAVVSKGYCFFSLANLFKKTYCNIFQLSEKKTHYFVESGAHVAYFPFNLKTFILKKD